MRHGRRCHACLHDVADTQFDLGANTEVVVLSAPRTKARKPNLHVEVRVTACVAQHARSRERIGDHYVFITVTSKVEHGEGRRRSGLSRQKCRTILERVLACIAQ